MSRATWYGDGLRWIGSLFQGAADIVERPLLEPPSPHRGAEDSLNDTRLRILARTY